MTEEGKIQRDILDYCAKAGIFARRRNVAGVQRMHGHFVKLGTKGEADIWGIGENGRHWECEVKIPGRRPDKDQEAWLRTCTIAGAYAFWVASLDEFVSLIRIVR